MGSLPGHRNYNINQRSPSNSILITAQYPYCVTSLHVYDSDLCYCGTSTMFSAGNLREEQTRLFLNHAFPLLLLPSFFFPFPATNNPQTHPYTPNPPPKPLFPHHKKQTLFWEATSCRKIPTPKKSCDFLALESRLQRQFVIFIGFRASEERSFSLFSSKRPLFGRGQKHGLPKTRFVPRRQCYHDSHCIAVLYQ